MMLEKLPVSGRPTDLHLVRSGVVRKFFLSSFSLSLGDDPV